MSESLEDSEQHWSDRAAAEYVLSVGGLVQIHGQGDWVAMCADIWLSGIFFALRVAGGRWKGIDVSCNDQKLR
jgi:hypothetical protein